jgi:hypothetical protein
VLDFSLLPEHLSIDRARRIADEFARTMGFPLSGLMLDRKAEPERCDFPLYMKPPGYPSSGWVYKAVRDGSWIIESSTIVGASTWAGRACTRARRKRGRGYLSRRCIGMDYRGDFP